MSIQRFATILYMGLVGWMIVIGVWGIMTWG